MTSSMLIEGLLLDRLSEDERGLIEQRILADPAFLEQVLIAEEDMLDLYVDGKLLDGQGFLENMLSASGQQEQKLLTAISLKRYLSEQDESVPQSELALEHKSESWLRRFLLGDTKLRRSAEVNLT